MMPILFREPRAVDGQDNQNPGEMRANAVWRRVLACAAAFMLLLLAAPGWSQSLTAQLSNRTAPQAAGSGPGSGQGSGSGSGSGPVQTASAPQSLPAKLSGKLHLPQNVNPAAATLDSYLDRVRMETAGTQQTMGSIFTDAGRLTRMSTDVRAMRPHDLISVVISESLAASTDGEVKNTRASNANSQVTTLFGQLHAANALQNLVAQNSAAGLNAQGQSVTNSSLSTTLGGEVVEVLPNGMLVIEAARQVEFNQQTETIVLRGLVRPEDLSQQNQVLSTAISSLELEVRGKGIINDYTRRQNPLVRLLEKIVIF